MSEYEQELEIQAEENNDTIKQQAEQIRHWKQVISGYEMAFDNAVDENQRLKEALQRVVDFNHDGGAMTSDVVNAEKVLKAAQPQGGSDE